MSSTDRQADPQAEQPGLHLEILTPESVLFEGDVDWIEVPLRDGLLGIWPGHAPLIGALAPGEMRFEQGGTVHERNVSDGVLRVGVERCAILLSRDTQTEQPSGDPGASMVDAIDEDLGAEALEKLGSPLREPDSSST